MPYGLIAISDTEFYCNDAPTLLKFVVDDKGKVNQVLLNITGREMTAVRVEEKAGN